MINRAFAQAVEQESLLRSSAFLELTETLQIAEGTHTRTVEVLPFTLRHLLELSVVKSPFLMSGLVGSGSAEPFIDAGMLDAGHVLSFLWSVSVTRQQFKGGMLEGWAKRQFVRWIRNVNFTDAVRVIRDYVREAFFDWPDSDGKPAPSFFSSHAVMVHQLATSYGWTRGEIDRLPLRAACQLFNLIRRDADAAAGHKTILFNPLSDRVRMEFLKAKREAEQRKAEVNG